MHSPFVFDFILHVLNNKNNYRPPSELDTLRRALLHDRRRLHIKDLGAGSRRPKAERSVAGIAGTAVKPKKMAELLFRLARHYLPSNILELGTSLGLTTLYLSYGSPEASITTLEGNPDVAALARENFKRYDRPVNLLEGNFDDLLPSVISGLSSIDLAYIDGNHRYGPTMDYFRQCLSRSHNDTILVFDDIHWSSGMEKAWEEIREHPAVQYTIDIFFMSFVFFRKEFRVKQHFTIRF